ncbi:MAG: CdvA-like protein [Candidatus Bathyarchaeia archaeon]
MISWKHSFNRLNEEYELAKKKKQALDNLLEKGRISQSTYDSFNSEIAVAIAEIEKQQQALISKMQLKTDELENQIKTLEMLLANYEIQHVAGEIDEETYKLEIELLSNGLAKTKHELESIKEATNQLCTPKSFEVTPTVAASPQVEVAPSSANNLRS